MSRKRIGILTFSYSSNPGSVLQAYSLQQNIARLGNYEPNIINYQKTKAGKPVIGKTVFMRPVKKWRIKNIIEWSARIVAHPLRMYKYERFFDKHYIGYPQKVCSRDDLKNIVDKFDAYVVGSDQVWNLNSYNVDTTFFLDFVDDGKKKISYAASFGQSGVPEESIDTVKLLMSDFESISVREELGIKTVEEITGKKAEWVLDPSLLTDVEDYRNLAKYPKTDKYVFLYLREESSELVQFAEKLAKDKGLKVVKVIKHWMCGKNSKPLYAIGPEQWLGYMDKAEYVVTNSFHGICFSLIFEKQFYVSMLKASQNSTNPRLAGVLKQFDLEDRYIGQSDDDVVIDYKRVNEIKENRKKQSLQYLKNAIERSVQI